MSKKAHISVVIPCFHECEHILSVIQGINQDITTIFVIDDGSQDGIAELISNQCTDKRVRLIQHTTNQGVGAAVISGYLAAVKEGADVIVKLDGDGQMNPKLISRLVTPILEHKADYTKGNRFYHPAGLSQMPIGRLVGNAILSFFTKFSSGYWNIFDPTNGYTAIHASLVKLLPPEKLHKRFFFESDMLFRLNTLRAYVLDIPMDAEYGKEKSSLFIHKIITPFIYHNIKNSVKRLIYSYFLRDFSIASIELVLGNALFFFGLIFGITEWIDHAQRNVLASTGTIMLASLPIIIGTQLILSFINFDIGSTPREVIHTKLLTEK